MINFDFSTLNMFLKENAKFLTGARFQKIQQPTRQDFVVSLRNDSENRKLYININPQLFHLCFMSKENEQKRFIEIPSKPPMFCMLLRKYLEGAKVSHVEQPDGERILEFYFETYNELSEKIYLCLAIELMGKHSNVVLYNYDTNVIIGCAHNVGEDKSRERHLMGGLPYVYPKKSLKNDFFGFSDLVEDKLKENVSINQLIDDYFAKNQHDLKLESTRTKILAGVNSKLKKVQNSLKQIKRQNKTEDKTKIYLKKANLLMANLYQGKDFEPCIEVFDYEENSNLKIDLDEKLTLKENANKFFKLYNKSKIAIEKSLSLIEELLAEKEYLEQILYSAESAEKMSDLLEIQEEIAPVVAVQKSKKSKSEVHVDEFLIGGFRVYLGRNNKQNDYIVSKLAKDEDLWFHTRNCAGSHVLLKLEKGDFADEKTIFECAKLAKEHSKGKNSSKVGVIYTKRKFLKKPPKAHLGYVTYKGEQEIVID